MTCLLGQSCLPNPVVVSPVPCQVPAWPAPPMVDIVPCPGDTVCLTPKSTMEIANWVADVTRIYHDLQLCNVQFGE